MLLPVAADPGGLVATSALHVGGPIRLLTGPTLHRNHPVGRHGHHPVAFCLWGGGTHFRMSRPR
jgi:hypothetical protein